MPEDSPLVISHLSTKTADRKILTEIESAPPLMEDDPFEKVLDLEDEFYKEGFDAGIADGADAGIIEGKLFGIEKGYEKAMDLGKLHGRAMVWESRSTENVKSENEKATITSARLQPFSITMAQLPNLPNNARLTKHVQNLLSITADPEIATDNSDKAVADFDERLSRAQAKAKVISNIVGESLTPNVASATGIEDATGLEARR